MIRKKIGLLIGDELDWPWTFESLARDLKLNFNYKGQMVEIEVERIRIHPFALTDYTGYNLVIDRLAYWHYQPREWLKKAALFNKVYLLNNPFTFQSMEKHSAYCAMLRLGLNIPETWLIPPRLGPEDRAQKYAVTAARFHDPFDLKAIAAKIGYPLYMKPFDGGGWRGVTRINNEYDLMKAYEESGRTLMHIQKGLDNYDVFVRSLTIGPQVGVFKYDPSRPMHDRYVLEHFFLDAEHGREVQIINKTINAFFRWDFNSCESILKNDLLSPIDFANACPDIAVTSLHYYYPWAIKSLLAWAIFSVVTEREMRIDMNMNDYFAIADSDRSYWEKLEAYNQLADQHFQKEEFQEFKDKYLAHLDGVMWQHIQSKDFDNMLVETIRNTYPAYEQERFASHFRGLLRHWVEANPA